jgi:hypothetical protein
MSQPLKNWKAGAYAALAEYYKVESERASFEERLEQAKQKCVRAGVSFRFGGPEVESAEDNAYACNCGAVVTYRYPNKPGDTHVCGECQEKASEAARADAELEGRPGAAKPKPAVAAEEIPF